jgi:hypothetical protein
MENTGGGWRVNLRFATSRSCLTSPSRIGDPTFVQITLMQIPNRKIHIAMKMAYWPGGNEYLRILLGSSSLYYV